MYVRIYSVHIEGLRDGGWEIWDVVNVALTSDAHSAPEAMAQGLETCREASKGETKPETLRIREVRFLAEGEAA